MNTDNRLGKTKSLTSMSSPDAAHHLPYTDDANRRERKNTENANIRNVADKFSDRKKVPLSMKTWKLCLHCESQKILFRISNVLDSIYVPKFTLFGELIFE